MKSFKLARLVRDAENHTASFKRTGCPLSLGHIGTPSLPVFGAITILLQTLLLLGEELVLVDQHHGGAGGRGEGECGNAAMKSNWRGNGCKKASQDTKGGGRMLGSEKIQNLRLGGREEGERKTASEPSWKEGSVVAQAAKAGRIAESSVERQFGQLQVGRVNDGTGGYRASLVLL